MLATKGGDTGRKSVAFSYNNKPWVMRVIAGPGDWVGHRREAGNVSVNGQPMIEPYPGGLRARAMRHRGSYQVPEGGIMGDHRASVDPIPGCISADQVEAGWPCACTRGLGPCDEGPNGGGPRPAAGWKRRKRHEVESDEARGHGPSLTRYVGSLGAHQVRR